jgi:acyl carrier protein
VRVVEGDAGMSFRLEDTQNKVLEMIAQKSKMSGEGVKLDATFKELGLDSLDIAELTINFEEIFGIEMSDEDAERIHSVRDAVTYIHTARTK